MLYQLEQGPTEDKIIEQAIRQNMPLPDRIANKPELHLGLELYYDAFADLCTTRQVGMGLGPLNWITIQGYGKANDYDEDQLEALHYFMPAMDDVYLEYQAKQADKKSGKSKGISTKANQNRK